MESNNDQHKSKLLNIDGYIKTFSLAGLPLALTMSSVYLWSYYSLFGINIFEFVSISDVLLVSLKPLIIVAALIYVALSIESTGLEKDSKRISRLPILMSLFTTTGSIAAVAMIIFIPFTGYTYSTIMLVLTTAIAVLVFVFDAKTLIAPNIGIFKGAISVVFSFIASIYVAILLFMLAFGQFKAHAVRSDTWQLSYKTTIIEPTKENKNLRFIGKAGSHFFLWDSSLGRTHILRVDSVNHLMIETI